MVIINLVDNISPVNTGIWKAAVSTTSSLKRQFNYSSEIWYPAASPEEEENLQQNLRDCSPFPLSSTRNSHLEQIIQQRKLTPENTVFVSHGCWQYPTLWGAKAVQLGFTWIYVPHGMLEPWPMQTKKWKKLPYFHLIEKRKALQADVVRAVGTPELHNLLPHFPQSQLIPNGVPYREMPVKDFHPPYTVLFMGRLHHKKGIVELVQAWKQSKLFNHPDYRLKIAGPDDGELPALLPEITGNMEYLGPVYGKEKDKLLKESHFFTLPSHSEGFPTAVLEGMQYGLIPLISEGCNFPEAFEKGLGIKVSPVIPDVVKGLNQLLPYSPEAMLSQSSKGAKFVNEHYSLDNIAQLQGELAIRLLGERKAGIAK
jgi:glycosyltransferase involved in cell wall biosynthesis